MDDRGSPSDRGGSSGPRRRDPDAARRRILLAAEREFAARGPAGARVDRIARAAGLNKRMLYHYFGGKQTLYRTVLDRAWPGPGEGWRPSAARLLLWSLLDAATAGEVVTALRRRGALGAMPAAAGDGPADPVVAVVESWRAAPAASRPAAGAGSGAAPRHKPRIRLKPRRD